jgi:TonB family protein
MRKTLIGFLALCATFLTASASELDEPKFEKDFGVVQTPWGQQHCYDRLRPKTPVAPRYPSEEIRSGVTGAAILAALVEADGKVKEVSVLKSSGSVILDKAASVAFLHWRYQPAKKGVSPKEFVTLQPFVFEVK